MVHALMRGKFPKVGDRDPLEVEDLLTSVVLGTASYVDPEHALLPFLREARGANGEVPAWPAEARVECEFWPRWPAFDVAGGKAAASGAEPELVVRLTDQAGRRFLALVEVKLWSPISSVASQDMRVTHQLAKYWLHLVNRAVHEGSTPLGVFFVTEGISFPEDDVAAAVTELENKGHCCPALFWVSWRRFERVARSGASRQLDDVVALLRDHWELAWVADKWTWPAVTDSRAVSSWYANRWKWPPCGSRAPRGWFHG